MNLDQARRNLSDGFRVSLKGKELTIKNGKFLLGGKAFTPTSVETRTKDWILIKSNEVKPKKTVKNVSEEEVVKPVTKPVTKKASRRSSKSTRKN